MFDISWTEFLLIGVVALIVIGPKELPGVMRTVGQYTRKIRGLASEFQNQFQEALREAEMADLKKQVDDMASDIKNYDPLKDVRAGVESLSKDVEKSLDPAAPAAPPALEQPPSVEPAAEGTAIAAAPAPAMLEAAPSESVAASPAPVPVALPDAGTVAPVPTPPTAPASAPVVITPEGASTERTG